MGWWGGPRAEKPAIWQGGTIILVGLFFMNRPVPTQARGLMGGPVDRAEKKNIFCFLNFKFIF